MIRQPGLTVVAAASLALGVGALALTFTVVDAALWRAPPFADADRLAMPFSLVSSPREVAARRRWSYPAIQQLRSSVREFAVTANYTAPLLTLTGVTDPEAVPAEAVSASYLQVLQIRPALGRNFLPSEDSLPGIAPVAMISHALWLRRYGADPALVGKTIQVSGQALTVVGVLPARFRGLSDKAQLWIPAMMSPSLNYPEYLTTPQNFISVVARLEPGVSLARFASATQLAAEAIERATPTIGGPAGETRTATAVSLNEARIARTTRRSALTLLTAVALLYLLACANVTNMLLGQASSRRRDAAVRAALGAGMPRLLRHYLTGGVILVLAGGAAGIALAAALTKLLTVSVSSGLALNFYGSLAQFAAPAFGARSYFFGVGLTLLTILLVAWAPAMSVARTDILAGLKEGARGASSKVASLRHPSLRGVIVAAEAMLATLLLITGGLMIDSFRRMRQTDLGVDPDHVLTFWLRPPEARVPPAAAPAFITKILHAIENVPGVVAATVDGGAPANGSARNVLFIAGRDNPAPNAAPPIMRHYVAPDHFRVLGIPLRRGRAFNASDDATHPGAAIISESAARHFWPGADPIGQRIWFSGSGFSGPDSSATIVGIAGDIADDPLDVSANRDAVYTPYMQFTYSSRMVFVRTAGDPAALVAGVRRAVSSVDPDLPLVEVQPLAQLIDSSWTRHEFDAWLFGGFAVVALLLAATGIYAVVSFAVGLRTREMGIRIALGAQAHSIVRLVVFEGLGFPLVGLALGAIASFAISGLLRASLYQVHPTDPVVLGSAVGTLLLVSLVACLVPAIRATTVEPVIALRAE